MKANMGAHLHVVRTKYVARSHKYTTAEEASSLSELDEASDTGAVMRRKVRAMQESRIARVEALRAQVRAGTYQVDTILLAQRILEDESLFGQSDVD